MNVKFVENWVFFEIVISFKIVFFIEISAMWWLFLIPRGAPDLTCLRRGREWGSLAGIWVQMDPQIDVFYIQPVYEH